MDKTCCRCRKTLPMENFGRLSAAFDGLNYACKDCVSSRNKQARKPTTAEYRQINQRRRSTPAGRIKMNLRSRTSRYLRRVGETERFSVSKALGCTANDLRNHLETQFTPEMNWDNYGTYWNIDHKVPLFTAGSDLSELERLSHYTNLRPLLVEENSSSGAKEWYNRG